MMTRTIPLLLLAVALAGCPKSDGDKPTPSATVTAPAAPSATPIPSVTAPPVMALPTAELKINTSGATMTYDVTKFEVTAGQKVHVVLDNKGPGALAHNWVLLQPGKEASYAATVMMMEKEGYYKDAEEVLAHVDGAKPGTKTETTFTAPKKPGDYPYICSLPGHYIQMKGVLTVKAP